MKGLLFFIVLPYVFAALPSTTNYQLNSYEFGSGGTVNSHTANYSLEGVSGGLSGSSSSTANSKEHHGYTESKQANVPKLVSLDNGSGEYYNKLHFVIDQQGNPGDAKYLIAVSDDNFVSDIRYLRTDGTLSSTIDASYYQNYSLWGGSSGSFIIGLEPSTTYTVKLKATQGDYTESAFGPTLSESTASPTLTFGLETSSSPTPPFSVSLGTMHSGDINSSDSTINTTVSTNGASGANVYVIGKNGALKSGSTGSQINSLSNDLANVGSGFGLQNSSISQTSGGPYTVVSPYNVGGTSVGAVGSVNRSLYSSVNPVTGGVAELLIKAKSSNTNSPSEDYQEILTFVAAGNF